VPAPYRAPQSTGTGFPNHGGATAALPPCSAGIRPPGPAALQELMTRDIYFRGGATAALPPCSAGIRPPGPAALQKMEGQRPRCPCAPHASGRRGRRPSKEWRGNGLVALVPRTHQAAVAGSPPKYGGAAASLPLCPARIRPPRPAALQRMEGQRPRCPCAPHASGRRGRRPSLVAVPSPKA